MASKENFLKAHWDWLVAGAGIAVLGVSAALFASRIGLSPEDGALRCEMQLKTIKPAHEGVPAADMTRFQAVFRTADGRPDPGLQKRGCSVMELGFRKSPPQTFYTKYGNVFIGLCGAFFVVVLMFALQNWRTYHQAFEDAFAKAGEKD